MDRDAFLALSAEELAKKVEQHFTAQAQTGRIYKRAWEIARERIQTEKTSWGRNELNAMMAEAFEQAVNDG